MLRRTAPQQSPLQHPDPGKKAGEILAGNIFTLVGRLIAKSYANRKATHLELRNGKKRRTGIAKFRMALVVIVIASAVIAGLLGYFGGISITANGGLTHIQGGEAAFDSVVAVGLSVLLIVVPSLIAVLGVWLMLVYTAWGALETLFGSDTAEDTARLFKSPGAKFLARFAGRWIAPVALVGASALVVPLIFSQVIGLVLGLIINCFWRERRKPYIAYMQVVIDACISGYYGTLTPVHNAIKAINAAWLSGGRGILVSLALCAFFTGLWAVFHTNKE